MKFRLSRRLLLAGLLLAAAPAAHAQAKKTTKKPVPKKTATKAPVKAPAKPAAAPKPPTSLGGILGAVTTAAAPLSDAEANAGIKAALNQAITRAVQEAGAADGFNLNPAIRIPFPEDALVMKTTLSSFPGMSTVINGFETQLNRAAEAAAPKAKEIFLSALANITLTDALSLVTNRSPDAATQFLRSATQQQLITAFRPDISTALDQVGANNAYKKMSGLYNRNPLVVPVQTDLTTYATQKAVDGLFTLIAQEELKIRENPAARTSELLKRVFGMK